LKRVVNSAKTNKNGKFIVANKEEVGDIEEGGKDEDDFGDVDLGEEQDEI